MHLEQTPNFLRLSPKSPNRRPNPKVGISLHSLNEISHCSLWYMSSLASKSNKHNFFNCRCVSGGLWPESIDNVQCFFFSLFPSGIYTESLEPGCVGKDGTKTRGAVRGTKPATQTLSKYLLGAYILICHRLFSVPRTIDK